MRSLPILICLIMITAGISSQTPIILPPSQSDQIIIDALPTGSADPGDRIRYTVIIQNTGTGPATGVQLNAMIDPNTTFVPGSFRTSPLAANDAYTATGNVGISVPVGSGVKANDFDDNFAGLTITAGTFATTQAGSIMIAADGSFMYTPPAGFTGTDTYTYTLTDGNPVGLPVPLTDMGTVTFTVSNLIWFIDNSSVAATSDGRLTSPFKTLADFNAGSATAGNVIYIEHTGTNYTSGIVLQNNEKLFGEGHTGGANLADVVGFSMAPFSKTLPAINGMRPVITNTTAGGDGIALASGNTIRGLNVGASADFAIDDNADVGTLTISELDINNTSGAGFRTDNGGTLAVTIGSLTSTGGSDGINITGMGGSFTVTGATNISNSTTHGIRANGASANLSFGAITISNTGAEGIRLSSNSGTFTQTSGMTTINSSTGISLYILNGTGSITFGNIDINTRNNEGLRVENDNRNVTTGTVDIDNPNSNINRALQVLNPTGGVISFGATTINQNNTGGNGIEIQGNNATLSFASGSSVTGSTSHEININLGAGNVTYNGTVTNTSGGAVSVTSRTGGTVDLTGNITQNPAVASTAISVGSNSGGTIRFSGTSKMLTSSTATAVNLTTNTGATIEFTNGGLVINTTTGIGFNATGGGTVKVTKDAGTDNTITKSGTSNALNITDTNASVSGINFNSINVTGGTGTAVNISSSTGTKSLGDVDVARSGGGTGIFASNAGTLNSSDGDINSGNLVAVDIDNTALGMTLKSVSANGASNGIDLNTTTGSFTINGTGTTDGSGGTIQNITNRGVSATSATNLTLKNMTFTNANTTDASPCGAADNSGCNAAIYLNTVTTATLDNVDINGSEQQGINLREVSGFQLLNSTTINTGAGGDTEEAGLYALNLFGTCAITSCSLTLPTERAAVIYNTSKTLALTVTSSTFGMNQTMPLGADCFEISSFGTSNTTLDIVNSTFVQPKTNGLQVITQSGSFSSVDVTGSTFDPGPGLAAAIDLDVIGTGDMDFNIIGNPMIKGKGINIINVFAFPNGTFEGRINNNTVVNNGGSGAGIRVFDTGNGSSKVEIKDNNVTGGDDYGIDVTAQGGTSRLDATVTGNTVSITPLGFFVIHALAGASGSAFTNKVCANVANNTTTAPVGSLGNFQARSATAPHEILLQGGGTTVLTNWNANTNLPIAPPAVISQSGAGVFTFGATCLIPGNPLP